ncbi:acid shock protein [mine drainage metagenome]|uniref:Acid shock protein n=1 Tax=mine drainage metagenome TaxID=410659 RepID=A0A1J5RY42_9ZZZZ
MTIIKNTPAVYHYLFNEFFNNFPSTWGRDTEATWAVVPVNIYESENGFQVELNAPGRNKEDFKINIEKGLLTVSFEKKEEATGKELKTIRREFSYTNFKRSFSVDENINTEAIEAKYENGVLKLFLPKKEEVKISPKEITVK